MASRRHRDNGCSRVGPQPAGGSERTDGSTCRRKMAPLANCEGAGFAKVPLALKETQRGVWRARHAHYPSSPTDQSCHGVDGKMQGEQPWRLRLKRLQADMSPRCTQGSQTTAHFTSRLSSVAPSERACLYQLGERPCPVQVCPSGTRNLMTPVLLRALRGLPFLPAVLLATTDFVARDLVRPRSAAVRP